MTQAEKIRARATSYSNETFQIAIELASKIASLSELAHRTPMDLAYFIEKELDRLVQDGTLQFAQVDKR